MTCDSASVCGLREGRGRADPSFDDAEISLRTASLVPPCSDEKLNDSRVRLSGSAELKAGDACAWTDEAGDECEEGCRRLQQGRR